MPDPYDPNADRRLSRWTVSRMLAAGYLITFLALITVALVADSSPGDHRLLLAVVLMAAGVTGVCAWFTGSRIADPVTTLTEETPGTASGHEHEPREIAQVALALHASAAELRAAHDETAAARAAEAAFLATLDQQIRTPMNAMIGMTGLLLGTDLDERQRELVETVHASGGSLLATVDDVLDLARVDAGDLTLDTKPFALRRCVQEAMNRVAPDAAGKGLHLSSHLTDDCPETVVGDENRIRQILAGLLGNAVTYTEHGAVTVAVSAAPDLACAQTGRVAIRFAVRDTGIGIPADRLDRLFVPFSNGASLSLAVARRLAAAMDGGITVDSQPGHGSTFSVTLRLGTAAGAVPEPEPAVAVSPARSLLVLVAEDNPVDQQVARLLLEQRGHRVETAGDGETAVAAIRRTRYDLVLMDVQMPVLDGLTATRLIRADPPPHGAPRIVALTANAQTTDRTAADRAGMAGLLPKADLEKELDAVLAEAAAHSDVLLAGDGPQPGPDDAESDNIRACVDAITGDRDDDRHRVAELLSNFADRLPVLLHKMEDAAIHGDTRNLARLAHGLKGSSATLGANHFAAMCADLEDRALLDPDDSGELIRGLHHHAGAITGVMTSLSQELTDVR
ncbi:ATP-binding protein [Actinoplanes sp. NBRC 101535]|uniref:ATP-binding protein n=1 Tax=Actinoplanes sp. NBRC 101535 TaxID=3032196 RepID=UPI002555F82C|nr:ATP-binding protein [Actinoplanes sp. NBRC 101535]